MNQKDYEVKIREGYATASSVYTIHINITSFGEPVSDCLDFLDFKNLREFIIFLTEHGKEILDKMDSCDVEIEFKSTQEINGDIPWTVLLWEDKAVININLFGTEDKQLRECQDKLAKIRELVQ